MSPWLIGITVIAYGWTGCEQIAQGRIEFGTVWLCYACANVALLLSMRAA